LSDTVTPRQLWRSVVAIAMVLAFVASTTILYIGNNVFTNGAAMQTQLATNGFGLYVDGQLIAACANAEDIKSATQTAADTLAEAYGAPYGVHSLLNSVSVKSGTYLNSYFTDADGISALLGCTKNGYSFNVYTATGTLTDITLSVSTVAVAEKTEPIPKELVSVGTDVLPLGQTVTVTEGADGVALNKYSIVYVNGVKTKQTLLANTVVQAPVATEQWYGTDSGATLMSAGDKFALPCGGIVTSWYGGRLLWGGADFHYGLDFAGQGASYGDPIYAAEDGVVTYADYHGGFGLKITVAHTSQLSTLYAHCSRLLVKEGDIVRKGQLIAYIGRTGMVTGPHLHFELLKNGARIDPKPYINWDN